MYVYVGVFTVYFSWGDMPQLNSKRSENSFWELLLSGHHVSPRQPTQVVGLASRAFTDHASPQYGREHY